MVPCRQRASWKVVADKEVWWERTAAAPSRNSCRAPLGSTEADFGFGVNEGSRAEKRRESDLIMQTVCEENADEG